MKQLKKLTLTLALLIMAVCGAWAEDTYTVQFSANSKTVTKENVTLSHKFSCSRDNNGNGNGNGELDQIIKNLYDCSYGWCSSDAAPTASGNSNVSAGKEGNYHFIDISAPFEGTATVTGSYRDYNSGSYFTYTLEISIPGYVPVTPVTWDPATKTGYFTMPAYDVEIAPIYAPVAQWAKVENVDQLPTAIEGIYAESTDAIVKAGTVAFAGTSNEVTQGEVMYAVGTSATEQPALTAFSATLPTAKDITAAGDVYVWYYIKGADTPQGQTATAENTFNDSEICAEPIKVTVLSNKFDIQFNAANDNTIEAGKATVTVGGTDATVTEGKLEGVKMGSEVKLEAKPGYKFRKVEVKKKGAELPKYADVVTICEKNGENKYLISSFFDGTNANITTITKEEAIALAEYLGGGDIRVVYEEYEFSSDRYVRATNAAGNVTGVFLSTTNTFNIPLYYVPAGN